MMKKRLFAAFVSLCMIVSMLPIAALADAVVVVPPGGGDGGDVVVVIPPRRGGRARTPRHRRRGELCRA